MREILFLFLIISGLTVSSQDDIHNIDRRCQKCMSLDSNYTVSAMIRCVNKAQEEWDFKIKKYYKTLKDTLSHESAELLIRPMNSSLKRSTQNASEILNATIVSEFFATEIDFFIAFFALSKSHK